MIKYCDNKNWLDDYNHRVPDADSLHVFSEAAERVLNQPSRFFIVGIVGENRADVFHLVLISKAKEECSNLPSRLTARNVDLV